MKPLKYIVISASLMVASIAVAQTADTKLFEYPVAPAELERLNERTNYLVSRFWDKCNLHQAIHQRDAFKKAFVDYVSFMPYADADVVYQSIEALLSRFAKDPDKLLTLAEIAEETVYDPDGEFMSDDIYLPFAKAVVAHKKISSANKARFVRQVKILEQSQVGMKAPEIKYTDANGGKGRLSDLRGKHILLFINDPDCGDCQLARVRLSADPNINDLIDRNYLTVVSIYPGEADDEWKSSVSNYNKRWIVGASEDVPDLYDMRVSPVLYYLNPSQKILSKTLLVDNLIEAFRQANLRLKMSEEAQQQAVETLGSNTGSDADIDTPETQTAEQ